MVDDDPDILDALQLILFDAGYDVYASLQGKAVENLCNGQDCPDLLLLDVSLSGMDGRELCRKLKNCEKTKELPVVMISAHLNAQQGVLKAGADAFLPKPFDIDTLLYTINRFVI